MTRRVALRLVRDAEHYDEVIARGIERATVSVWIATANLKDLRVEAPVGTRARARGRYVSIVERFADLVGRGIDVRILHATDPSRPFRAQLARLPAARRAGLSIRQCPRVHLKMVAIDGSMLYLGSANFTGAGLGARGEGRRNFEAGIVTDDEHLLDEMQATFERIWSGRGCKGCRLRSACPSPLDLL
jgi:phosphatidylserine/phosphatidylglycerophosphate/cardiolipin synthase-like enzyme